ncbi:MAG: nucleoside diphosphate kinase regulator [Anaerolineales bacterium]|nr:nucleoside diphosphate kinase regulator [Anaerolineales bacterium]
MGQRNIHITEFDLMRLRSLIIEARYSNYRDTPYLDSLAKELNEAIVVPSKEMPPDVITMNSRVRLRDLDADEEMVYTLVFPEDANISQGKVSVLAPIGTAMLGYRVGEIFEWQVPEGIRKIKIEEMLYQPEASGDYDV